MFFKLNRRGFLAFINIFTFLSKMQPIIHLVFGATALSLVTFPSHEQPSRHRFLFTRRLSPIPTFSYCCFLPGCPHEKPTAKSAASFLAYSFGTSDLRCREIVLPFVLNIFWLTLFRFAILPTTTGSAQPSRWLPRFPLASRT